MWEGGRDGRLTTEWREKREKEKVYTNCLVVELAVSELPLTIGGLLSVLASNTH